MCSRVVTLSRIIAQLFACCFFLTVARGYNFSISTLQGVTLSGATSLQFGPDQRLYVSQVNGVIKALTVQRDSANNYRVTATETINLVRDIPNYDDSGTRNFSLTSRQVTGLLVVGTATNPVLYVASSDPRIGGGSGGENDLNLDTNSGIVSRLTKSGTTWTRVDLVRGLPRSEENHASNGMQLEPLTNTLYLAQGGNNNAGGPSINFAYACETALSAAILSINLTALNAMPVKTDAYGQKYVYNLPTLNDPNPNRAHNADGTDVNDPFGGSDGLNQAKLVPGGPVQIYAPGFRNAYDIVLTRAPNREGRLYTFDNGANQGWGGYPKNEGGGTVTNEYVEGEPGAVNNLDHLQFIAAKGYYGGHPNPIRANPAGAGWFHFDNTKPTGAQKVYSTQPTADWPPVPVSLAKPLEGDFRQPGSTNGALLTNNQSTNGLTEYISTNFSGEMQGNLLAASYDGRLLRVALSPDGTAVTNGLETLATGFGSLPLDVTAPDPGNGAAFVGTIWVAHYSPAKISILEPADFDSPGGATCTGINSFDVDEDQDGYSNADEIANDSDPCSGAIRPPDVDGDHVSDLLDQDDDNDGVDDTQDVFPLDAENGSSVPMPVHYELFNSTGSGFYGVGLTGVMIKRGDDYLQRLSTDNVIAGGTAGLFTIAKAGAGIALGSTNTQKDAYQFGINSDEFTSPFVITSRLAGPFFGNSPTGSQRQGIYMGTGDQNTFVWTAVHANNGAGGFEVVYERGDTIISQNMYPFSGIGSNSTIDLSFVVDPVAGTIQPGYRLASSPSVVSLGNQLNVTGAMLQSVMGSEPLAIGLFATTAGTGPTFAATWDYFDVTPVNATSLAKVTVDPSSTNMASSSTYAVGSFQIQNLSTSGQHIESVTIDLTTAIFPDMVYDPNGTAGDTVAKPFQADSASSGVSLASGVVRKPHNGSTGADGYDELFITFNSFPVNGTFTFSIDCDPTSIKGASGSVQPGSVSGLELIGSTVEVFFSDGTVHRSRLGRVANSVDGSYGWLRSDEPPQPGISFIGKASPLKSGLSPETVRVTGPAGLTASVVTVEGALDLAAVPNGGYDLDSYEANTAIKVSELTGTISSAGYKDFNITPTKTNAAGGYNYISAVLSDTAGIKGTVSDKLTIWYDPSFTSSDSQPPTTIGSLTSPNITSRSVTLSWSASSDNIGVQAYDVLRDGVLVTSVDSLSYTDIGLDAGVAYNYSVVARDAAGNISPSATISATTLANGSVVLRINAGGPSFVDRKGRTWSADSGSNTGTTTTVTNAIDRAIDDPLFQTDRVDSVSSAPDLAYAFNVANGDYEVQLFFAELNQDNSAVGKRVFDVVVESQLAFDNLDIFALAGAPYTAVVVATNTTVTDGQLNIAFPRGSSNPKVNAIKLIKLSSPETVPPSTPTNFKATAITANSVTLAWNASTDNQGVAGYVVARNGTNLTTTANLSITDTPLNSSTQYQYSVRAVDEAGNMSSAASVTVTTLSGTADTTPPSPPGGLSFSNVTTSSITVNWSAATDNVGVTGYRVSRGTTELATITALKYIDTGLTAGTSYNYSVIAIDAAGNASSASAGAAATSGGGSSSTIRVNAGGPSYVDTAGNNWSADTGYNTGSVSTTTTNVTGTTDPTLYKTSRFPQPSDPPLTYTFAMPNGSYLVRLHFAETYTGTMATGKRVFDVDIQSARAFEDVDIFARVGGNKALVLEKAASVTNGQMKIGLVRQVENPKINAIEIVPVVSSGPIRINAGGPSYAGAGGASWSADTGYNTGSVSTSTVTVSGTQDPTLFKTERYEASGNPPLVYSIPVPNGKYMVRLYFAETYTLTQGPAKRVFDVSIESVPAFTNLDIFTLAGGGNKALVLEKLTTVSDGQVNIGFTRKIQNPKINAIEILPSTGTTDTQPPTAPGTLTFSAVSSNGVTVNWTAATDNVAVTSYRISRGSTVLSTVSGLNYNDTGLTASTSYTYSVVALDAAGNVSPAVTGTIATTAGGTTSNTVRVNAGGPSYTDGAGNTWLADTGYNTGSVSTTTTSVTGTTNPTLYKTSRFPTPTDPPLTYTLSVPNGSYLVRLHFAEVYAGAMAVGKRVFDIDIQSARAFEDVDIFARAGGNKALILETAASVTNGQMKIGFVRQVENPKINAIEIVPTTVVRINAGGPSYAGAGGASWSADTGFNTGTVSTTTVTVSGTQDPTLFKTERYEASGNPPLIYSIPVPNGKYMVRLYFAETYSGAQGPAKRVFDVSIESAPAFTNLDIFALAGGGNKSLVLEKVTTVSDGQVNIGFARKIQNPKINAIQLFSIP